MSGGANVIGGPYCGYSWHPGVSDGFGTIEYSAFRSWLYRWCAERERWIEASAWRGLCRRRAKR